MIETFQELSKEMYIKETQNEVIEIIELPEDAKESKKILRHLNKEFKILEPVGASNELPKIAFKIGMVIEEKLLGKEEPKQHFVLNFLL